MIMDRELWKGLKLSSSTRSSRALAGRSELCVAGGLGSTTSPWPATLHHTAHLHTLCSSNEPRAFKRLQLAGTTATLPINHMPRVPPSALRTARSIHPHLAKLLPVCRDLRSAENELRWLRECARNTITHDTTSRDIDFIVSRLVHRRSRGEPLQYLLGSEYFGELELKCRPGVLIPR